MGGIGESAWSLSQEGTTMRHLAFQWVVWLTRLRCCGGLQP
jgi:hypothetical protein